MVSVAQRRDASERRYKRWAVPVFIGAVVAGVVLVSGEHICKFAVDKNLKLAQAYSAIAGLASVLAGFLGVFYGLVVAKTSEFMQRLEGQPNFVAYTIELKRAMILACIVAVATVPMMVVEPLPGDISLIRSWAVAIWMGFVAVMLVLAWRVASEFFILVEPLSKN